MPAKTSPQIVSRLNADSVAAVTDPPTRRKLEDMGVVVIASTPSQLAQVVTRRYGQMGADHQGREDRDSRMIVSQRAEPQEGDAMITRRKLFRCPQPRARARRRRPSALAQAPPAQGWPARFVRLVVPFTPGGGIDGIGRIVGARLSEMWGQQVVVENKPGAGGNIASEFVARSAPDGYTMYITAGGLAVNHYLFPSISYDPVADFAPVTLICLFPNLLVVPNSSPLRSVGDLLAQAGATRARSPSPRRVTAARRI